MPRGDSTSLYAAIENAWHKKKQYCTSEDGYSTSSVLDICGCISVWLELQSMTSLQQVPSTAAVSADLHTPSI